MCVDKVWGGEGEQAEALRGEGWSIVSVSLGSGHRKLGREGWVDTGTVFNDHKVAHGWG